eukprot:8429703-Pyramimonas_sp.AAC.1
MASIAKGIALADAPWQIDGCRPVGCYAPRMHDVGDVVFVVVHLAAVVGLAGPSAEVLSAVAAYPKVRGLPCVAMADWNMETHEVDQMQITTHRDGSW